MVTSRVGQTILHPTDFSAASHCGFVHALALSLAFAPESEFTVLNASPDGDPSDWARFPRVRRTLEAWGCLPLNSARSEVFADLGVAVKKVGLSAERPLRDILGYLEDHPTDLIVLATEGRTGIPGWLKPSFAEHLARGARTASLFVREGCRGFVDEDSGRLRIKRVLVPVDDSPDPAPALEAAATLARQVSGDGACEAVLVHVGPAPPRLRPPAIQGVAWREICRQGPVVDTLVECMAREQPDLVVVATEGRHGILDALRGSVSEQLLRRSPCPLLSVPG